MTMHSALATVGLIVLAMSFAAHAQQSPSAPDFSSFGVPVETTKRERPAAQISRHPTKLWPAHVCAEIQRVEDTVISGALPDDRAMTRIGLLTLEQLHCGIDVSEKLAADQAILDRTQRRARRDFEENLAAARAAPVPQEPIIVQVPQAAPEPAVPVPSPPMNCFTTRFGGGMSSTTCR